MTTESESGESESKKKLLLEVLKYFREQGKFPEVGAFRSSHSDVRGVIDGLVQEGLLESSQGYYRLTLDGLLWCGVREAEEEFARFDRVLPYLKEAYRQDARKQWNANDIANLSQLPQVEVARTLMLFVPEMHFWGGSSTTAEGHIAVGMTEKILELEPFGDVASQLLEQEGLGDSPRVTELRVSGYRALEGFVAQFEALTVIIGANASGKSSLMDFLAFLSFAAANPLPPKVIDPYSIGKALFHAGSAAKRIAFSLRVEGTPDRNMIYSAKILGPVDAPQVVSEKLASVRAVGGEQKESFTFIDFKQGRGIARRAGQLLQRTRMMEVGGGSLVLAQSLKNEGLPTQEEFREFVRGWRFYSGFKVGVTAVMRRPVRTEHEPMLKNTGSNLSAVLAYMIAEHRERWEELETHLRSAIPMFRSLGIKFTEQPGTVIGTWREEGVAGELTLADLSDGTLRFLCWAVLCLARKPPLICIDEPEVGLHPRVLPVLAGLLRQASSESQILVATHSPYFLSQFSLEEIAVMKKVEGRAVFARPSSNEALRREIEELGGDLAQLHISDELEARS